MINLTARRISNRIKRLERSKVSRSIGLVANDSPLTVMISGALHTDLPKLSSYTSPVIGDRVLVLRSGSEVVICGPVSGLGSGSSFILGVNPGSAPYYNLHGLGARAATPFDSYRVGIQIDTFLNDYEATATWLDYLNGLGIKPLVTLLFYNRIPTVGECNAIDGWLDTYASRILALEFGNETSFSYQSTSYTQGALYASRCATAYTAVQGRVPFIIQASQWVDDLYTADPDIEDYCDGWTIHRYQTDYETYIDAILAQTTKPLWITEIGFATDDGLSLDDNYTAWPVDMTYADAADAMQDYYDYLRSKGSRVAAMYVYRGADGSAHGANGDKENYFGVLNSSRTRKGAYTTKVLDLIDEVRAE